MNAATRHLRSTMATMAVMATIAGMAKMSPIPDSQYDASLPSPLRWRASTTFTCSSAWPKPCSGRA